MYTTLKFVHIMAAIVWIGAGLALSVLMLGMVGARDYVGALALNRRSSSFGKVLFAPSAVTTLLAGIAMVVVGGLSFGDAWIVIGLVGVALSFVFGAGLSERASRDLGAALTATVETPETADHAAMARLRRRVGLFAAIDLTILTVVVWAMVAKP